MGLSSRRQRGSLFPPQQERTGGGAEDRGRENARRVPQREEWRAPFSTMPGVGEGADAACSEADNGARFAKPRRRESAHGPDKAGKWRKRRRQDKNRTDARRTAHHNDAAGLRRRREELYKGEHGDGGERQGEPPKAPA